MPSPKVLLDATAVPAARGGVGRYVDELAAALDGGGGLSIACQQRDADTFSTRAPQARVVALSGRLASRPARLGWEQTGLPMLARRLKVDVVHSPHYTMPMASPVPVVVTLHDATFFSDRELHLGVKGRFFRGWTKYSLRHAAVCVVDSAATGDELVRLASADPAKLQVGHLGVDRDRFAVPDAGQVRAARDHLGIGDRKYLAFLATHEPRKNIPALVAGFVRAAGALADPPVLVLAGAPGWDRTIDDAVAGVPDRLTVLRPGYLPVELLAGYLGGAEIVTYPSLGEGFGLPVLEGMACGAAVLTTRRLSLPEVGGDAVAYCEPDEADIARAITDLLDRPELRAELGRRGVQRAALFSWQACAEACREAYQRAVATSGAAR
ncbi:glycosyltransferase family 4 protein [Nakamurella lactea]|uniref:glycosyltransferase family 4 protein n=1 Tax=Nakamurella lactea TaxID=459515 RepID=UPI0003F628F3